MSIRRREEFELLKKELHSIALSVGNVVYVSLDQLDRDYADLNGHPIRYHDFGFKNLYDMIASMADAMVLMDRGAEGFAVVPISDRKTKHLEHLIAEQKPTAWPTRFGGVVPGLDNKENNRQRNLSREWGRSDSRRTMIEEQVTNHKRSTTTVGLSAIFPNEVVPPVQPSPAPRQIVSVQLLMSSAMKSIEQSNNNNNNKSNVNKLFGETNNNNNFSEPQQSNKIAYSRKDLLELRKSPICSTVNSYNASSFLPNDYEKKLKLKNEEEEKLNDLSQCYDDDYPEMDLLQFVVANVISIVKWHTDGINLQSLKMLYKTNFPNDPPLELIESLGYSLEDFFVANCLDELEYFQLNNEFIFRRKIVENEQSHQQIATLTDAASMNFSDNLNLSPHFDDKSTDDSQSSLLDAPVGSLDKNLPLIPKTREVDNLIFLDDDPAVLAFERRPTVATSPIPMSVLMQSPLFSRKVVSSNSYTTATVESLLKLEPADCGASACASTHFDATSASCAFLSSRSVGGGQTTPKILPVEIREKFEKLLKYSDDLSLPYANFKTLFTQRSMLVLFTLYGFANYDQVIELASKEKLLEIYVPQATDQKRIRLV